jgi:hypothetical protein
LTKHQPESLHKTQRGQTTQPYFNKFLENVVEQNTLLNNISHRILYVGSYMGVATLPIWTILTGLKLLREKRLDEHAALQEHTALQEL